MVEFWVLYIVKINAIDLSRSFTIATNTQST